VAENRDSVAGNRSKRWRKFVLLDEINVTASNNARPSARWGFPASVRKSEESSGADKIVDAKSRFLPFGKTARS